MKDINFFSIYYDKSSIAYKRKRMLEIGLLILLIIAITYAGLTFWKIAMEKETQEINEYLMSEEAQESMAEYNLQSAKLKAIQDYNLAAGNLIGSMEKIPNITTNTLSVISGAIPNSARLESMTYNRGEITLIADVGTLDTAAQMQVRLEETNLFQTVILIGATSKEGGGYSCSLRGVLKVGENNESNL